MLSLTFVIGLGYLSLACQAKAQKFEYRKQEATMILLHIALQDGFVDDKVVIQVNGGEVFYKSGVRTRFQIGLADSLEMNVQGGTVNVEVILPLRHLSKSIVWEVSDPTYLGVSITTEGEIDFRISNERFRYM